MHKPTVLCIASLMHGNGGKYIATNIAYCLKKDSRKKDLKIALIDFNRYNNCLAKNLEVSPEKTTEEVSNNLTTYLKFGITKLTIEDFNNLEEFKKLINSELDYVIVSVELENLDVINQVCKNKTNILVVKQNYANNSKIEANIDMIKENFKYIVVNCPEKTVKLTKILKENNIKVIGRTQYNEYTLDNVNIQKATKINKIKYIRNFKRITLIKVRKKAER